MKTLILYAMLLLPSICFGQKHDMHPFRLNGKVNVDTGDAELIFDPYSEFYPADKLMPQKTKIVNGKFLFTGEVLYPLPCQVRIGDYISDIFYIEAIDQNIICNTDSFRKVPYVSNRSTQELKKIKLIFSPYYRSEDAYRTKYDSLEKLRIYDASEELVQHKKSDKKILDSQYVQIFYNYVSANRKSTVAMWKMARALTMGYFPGLDAVYDQFDDELKNTYTGIAIKNNIQQGDQIGKIMSAIEVLDTSLTKRSISLPNKDKLTFIDFWFSSCGPCLGQLKKIKVTYDKHKSDLQVIGISVDKTDKTIQAWRKVIADKNLDWPQYLDDDNANAKIFKVYGYPTNFLLDENGTIIYRNITPEYLDRLLLTRLQKNK